MSFNPQAYAPGDVVKIIRTIKVSDVFGGRIYGHDVQSDYYVNLAANGTARVEMVKRSARRKPKTGEILLGKEVGHWSKWKRGSVIRCTLAHGLSALVLFADGKWHDIEGVSAYGSDDLAPEAPFEVLLVA